MEEFTRVLAEGLQKGNVLLVIALLVVIVVLNAHKLHPILVERKRHRLKSLDAALDSEWVRGKERICLQQQAATEHFHAATGIMLEKAPRDALLKIYERSEARLPFVHFKRAVSYVRYENGEFEIRLGRFERWMMWAGVGAGFLLVPASLAAFVWTLYALVIWDSEPLGSWKVWLFFNVAGWASVMSSRPAYSANRIRKEMERQAGAPPSRGDAPDTP